MDEDFAKWHELKIRLNKKNKKLYFRPKEIWWCILGLNIGYEQDGKNARFQRPVLILKKFNNDTFLGIPLTSQPKESIYYFKLQNIDTVSFAILFQIKLFSAKRLFRKMCTVDKETFCKIKKSFIDLIK